MPIMYSTLPLMDIQMKNLENNNTDTSFLKLFDISLKDNSKFYEGRKKR